MKFRCDLKAHMRRSKRDEKHGRGHESSISSWGPKSRPARKPSPGIACTMGRVSSGTILARRLDARVSTCENEVIRRPTLLRTAAALRGWGQAGVCGY